MFKKGSSVRIEVFIMVSWSNLIYLDSATECALFHQIRTDRIDSSKEVGSFAKLQISTWTLHLNSSSRDESVICA